MNIWTPTITEIMGMMFIPAKFDAADVVPQHWPLYVTLFISAATSKTEPLKLP